MAQLTDLEKVRRRRVWRKRVRSLFLLTLFAAIVFAASMLVYHKGEMDIKTAVGDITAEIGTGSGYPSPLPGGKLLQMTSADNALVVAADSNLYTYNATGRVLLNTQHGMITPTVTTAGSRILAYDRGANKVMLFSRSGLIRQITADFTLYDGDIAKNGNFALASGSDTHLSMVTVYNGEGAQICQCRFSDRPVISVSLADGRESMAVGLVDVRGGEYLSSIARFQFSIKEATAQVELPGELLLSVNYQDGSNVYAVTDRRVVVFNSDLRELASYPFEDLQLLRFRYSDGGGVLVHLRNATGQRKGQVLMLNDKLGVACAIPEDAELDDMKLDGSSIYLMRRGEIAVYDFNGQETGRMPVSGLGLFHVMGGTLYYTTSRELCAIETRNIAQTSEARMPEDGASAVSGQPAASSSAGGDRWELVKEALMGTPPQSAPEETLPEGGGDNPETASESAAEASGIPSEISVPEDNAGEDGVLRKMPEEALSAGDGSQDGGGAE